MVSARGLFIQHRHPAEDTSTRIFKQASRKPAAISRRASTFPTHQDGQPVRVRRSNVVWQQHHDTVRVHGGCGPLAAISLPAALVPCSLTESELPSDHCHSRRDPCCHLTGFPTHRCTAHSCSRRRPSRPQQRDQVKVPEHIITKLTQRLYNTDQINIICVLPWLSINNPAVSHTTYKIRQEEDENTWK